MDRLQNIETFVRVAQTQSFAEAARQLRVAKSVVTTRIKQLEDAPPWDAALIEPGLLPKELVEG